MKFLALLIIFIPFIVCAQPKYSSESKKLYTKALKAHKDGNTDVALGLFEQCVKSEPRYAEAYLNISIIQYGKKSMGDALINAKKAYSQNKFEPSIYGQLGKCYYQAMVYDSAAHFLTKAIELDIKDEFTLIYAGKSYYQLEDYAAAESHLTNAIAVNGNNPVAYNSRGKVYFNLAEYEKAEEDFKKALELNPESVSIYSNLANTCLRNEKPEDALKYINLAMEKANEDEKIQLLILLGNYYHQSGSFELAIDNFDKAFSLDQTNAHVLNNQAAVYLDQDNFDSAIKKCNEALAIEPECMEAFFNRGIAHEMLRNVVEACSDWEQAFILGSEKAEEYLNSATCNE